MVPMTHIVVHNFAVNKHTCLFHLRTLVHMLTLRIIGHRFDFVGTLVIQICVHGVSLFLTKEGGACGVSVSELGVE